MKQVESCWVVGFGSLSARKMGCVGLACVAALACKGETNGGVAASSSAASAPAPSADSPAAVAAPAAANGAGAAQPAAAAKGNVAGATAPVTDSGSDQAAATLPDAADGKKAATAAPTVSSGAPTARSALKGASNADLHATSVNVGSINAMSTDGAGNIYVHGEGVVKKLSEDLKEIWSSKQPQLGIASIAAAPNGEVYFTGSTLRALSGKTNRGLRDIVLGKLDGNGQVAWVDQTGSSDMDEGKDVFGLADGSAVFLGDSGQLPGQPPPPPGFPSFAMRYAADGRPTWVTQAAELPVNRLSIDRAGNLYGMGKVWPAPFAKLGSGGTIAWKKEPQRAAIPGRPVGLPTLPDVLATAPTPDGEGLYWVGGAPNRGGQSDYGCALTRMSADGSTWFRWAETETAVVEPVEQVTWQGTMAGCTALLTTSDAVFVAGGYVNSYRNGSTQRPTVATSFVARYDLEGNRVWFKQIEVPRPVVGGQSVFTERGVFRLIAGRGGSLIGATHTGFVFAIKAADGSPLARFALSSTAKEAAASAPAVAAPTAVATPAKTAAQDKAAAAAAPEPAKESAAPAPEGKKPRKKRER